MESAYAFVLEAIAVATDPVRRSFVPLRLLDPPHLHQVVGDTAMDRFPRIFSACRDFFGRRSGLNILSFGCATGEEVMTLAQYFPTATITGAEINRRSLAICRKREAESRIAFVRSDREAIRARGPFDAIFCMAVLQRTPSRIIRDSPPSLKRIYPFERFDAQISEFDRLLKKGGLLVVHAKAYPFSEASVAGRFVPLSPAPRLRPDGPKFDRHSLRLEGEQRAGSIFVKVE